MIRVIIEIDGKAVSSTIVQPTGNLVTPQELLARGAAIGAMDAGSAPGGITSTAAALDSLAAIDAGVSRAEDASPKKYSDEDSEDPKR